VDWLTALEYLHFDIVRVTRSRSSLTIKLSCLLFAMLLVRRLGADHIGTNGNSREVIAFDSEALANRAFYHLHSFAAHLRCLASREYLSSRTNEGQPAPPAPPPVTERSRTEPESPHDRRSWPDALDREFGLGGSEWDIPRLHSAALAVMETLDILTAFGGLQPPWIWDLTGRLGAAPTTAEAVAFLRRDAAAIALFHWSLPEATLIDKLLHEAIGGVLPLRRPDKMDLLRRRLRDLRVIWLAVPDPNETPSQELRAAANDLLFLSAILKRSKALDPSLAILAGADEDDGRPHRDQATITESTLVEDVLIQAQDIAVWEEDFHSAIHLLHEAKRFSELKRTSVAEASERDEYQRLATGADGLLHELTVRPVAYARRERESAWRQVNHSAHELLENTVGVGITVQLPGNGVDAKSPDGELEVIVTDVAREDRHPLLAPWLYGVDVSVSQHVGIHSRDEFVAVTDLPIALINKATGEKHVRRLARVETEDPEAELSTASFLNLRPGTYRVELVPRGWSPRKHDHPNDGDGEISRGFVEFLRRCLRDAVNWTLRWARPSQSRRQLQQQHLFAFKVAA
jgi:hypothetical protein